MAVVLSDLSLKFQSSFSDSANVIRAVSQVSGVNGRMVTTPADMRMMLNEASENLASVVGRMREAEAAANTANISLVALGFDHINFNNCDTDAILRIKSELDNLRRLAN